MGRPKIRHIFLPLFIITLTCLGLTAAPATRAASLAGVAFPAAYEGAGAYTIYDCSNKCGTGMFAVENCDPNKCDACPWPQTKITATLTAAKGITVTVWHACAEKNTCSVAGNDPNGCSEILSGTYDSFSLKFDLQSGVGPAGALTCYGDGSIDSETITIAGISCKTKKGQPALDVPGGITLKRTSADVGAQFSGMNGEVEVWLPGTPPDAWKLAKLDTPLPVGARVRTAEDSSCIIGFGDMSTFVMKPETMIEINTPPGKDNKIQLISGDVWINFKKMFKDGSMDVQMNQAVAGIKGTTLVVSDDGQTSTLKVIEGSVELTAKAGGKTETVNAGESLSATATGFAAKGTFDAAAESAAWQKLREPASAAAGTAAPAGAAGSRPGAAPWMYVAVGLVMAAIAAFAAFVIFGRKKRPNR